MTGATLPIATLRGAESSLPLIAVVLRSAPVRGASSCCYGETGMSSGANDRELKAEALALERLLGKALVEQLPAHLQSPETLAALVAEQLAPIRRDMELLRAAAGDRSDEKIEQLIKQRLDVAVAPLNMKLDNVLTALRPLPDALKRLESHGSPTPGRHSSDATSLALLSQQLNDRCDAIDRNIQRLTDALLKRGGPAVAPVLPPTGDQAFSGMESLMEPVDTPAAGTTSNAKKPRGEAAEAVSSKNQPVTPISDPASAAQPRQQKLPCREERERRSGRYDRSSHRWRRRWIAIVSVIVFVVALVLWKPWGQSAPIDAGGNASTSEKRASDDRETGKESDVKIAPALPSPENPPNAPVLDDAWSALWRAALAQTVDVCPWRNALTVEYCLCDHSMGDCSPGQDWSETKVAFALQAVYNVLRPQQRLTLDGKFGSKTSERIKSLLADCGNRVADYRYDATQGGSSISTGSDAAIVRSLFNEISRMPPDCLRP